MPKSRRAKLERAKARREAEAIAAGGRHRVDISDRPAAPPARINAALSRVTAVLNATLQTPEAWDEVWRSA